MLTPETVLIWSAAIILAAVALVVVVQPKHRTKENR